MARVPESIRQRRVFLDTSAFLAIVARTDRHHQRAEAIGDRLEKGRYRLFTTKYVVVESHAAILRAVGAEVGRAFLLHGLEEIVLLRVRNEDEARAKALVVQQRDKDYSFCDAISFAVMERWRFRLAFAFDDHFRQHGFSTPLDPLEWP